MFFLEIWIKKNKTPIFFPPKLSSPFQQFNALFFGKEQTPLPPKICMFGRGPPFFGGLKKRLIPKQPPVFFETYWGKKKFNQKKFSQISFGKFPGKVFFFPEFFRQENTKK